MSTRRVAASALIIAGGVIKIPLWILFISLHGPTSVNEEGRFLGGDPLIWGAIMSAVPSILVGVGLILQVSVLGAGRARRVGLILLLAGLLIPATVDLATRALWPPLLIPVVAVGSIIVAMTGRREPPIGRVAIVGFTVIGVLLAATFVYALAIPQAVFDAIDGYRIQGIVEHVLVGIAWVAVGVGLLGRSPARAVG